MQLAGRPVPRREHLERPPHQRRPLLVNLDRARTSRPNSSHTPTLRYPIGAFVTVPPCTVFYDNPFTTSVARFRE